MSSYGSLSISEFIGKTVIDIQNYEDRDLTFSFADGSVYEMYHEQDCCEDVQIEDIAGDLYSLIGSEIKDAYESSNSGSSDYGSVTWTFYVLRTEKDTVTIRWKGESNGYYSEDVTIKKIQSEIPI